MRNFLVEKSTTIATIIGCLCLILAAAVWYEGAHASREVQIMAENLGKDYTGGGWYPANGTDYDLEARVVGQEDWTTKAINVERGDQVEIRLRIASGDQLSSAQPSTRNLKSTRLSNGLTEVASQNSVNMVAVFETAGVPHVAYVPVGTYQVETNWLRDGTGQYAVGVSYDGADDTVFRDIVIVPPDSEIDFHLVLSFVVAGLVCFFVLVPLTVWLNYLRQKKSYAW